MTWGGVKSIKVLLYCFCPCILMPFYHEASVLASPLMESELKTAEGDCGDHVRLTTWADNDRLWHAAVLFGGQALILKSDFDELQAYSSCTLKFSLTLPDGYALKAADYIVSGQYQVGQNGKASIAVTHKILGSYPEKYSSSFYNQNSSEGPSFFYEAYARVEPKQIPSLFRLCSAKIELEVNVKLKIRHNEYKSHSSISWGAGFAGAELIDLSLQPCFMP